MMVMMRRTVRKGSAASSTVTSNNKNNSNNTMRITTTAPTVATAQHQTTVLLSPGPAAAAAVSLQHWPQPNPSSKMSAQTLTHRTRRRWTMPRRLRVSMMTVLCFERRQQRRMSKFNRFEVVLGVEERGFHVRTETMPEIESHETLTHMSDTKAQCLRY